MNVIFVDWNESIKAEGTGTVVHSVIFPFYATVPKGCL
jgi:hypothetical protein